MELTKDEIKVLINILENVSINLKDAESIFIPLKKKLENMISEANTDK